MTFDPAAPIKSVLANIIGQRAWLVRKGYSSFLTMEFGEPHLTVREPMPEAATEALRRPRVTVRGDWHLWIHSCNWSVSERDVELAHSESPGAAMEQAARAIDGQTLQSMTIDRQTGETRLVFELGTRLEMTAYDDESEAWLLYAPNGNVLGWRGDIHYSWQPGSTLPHEAVWTPLP